MPQDNLVDSLMTEDWGLQRAQHWTLKRCWFPKKCYLTARPLWGKLAYRGENWITGPGEPIVLYYWIEKNQFIIWSLKK